jgi:beta-galactosidase
MKFLNKTILLFCLCFFSVAVNAQQESSRVIQSFDAGWKFFKGDAKGAEQTNFTDASWRSLNRRTL